MREKKLICVICPTGCELSVDLAEGEVITVEAVRGYACQRGADWAGQELEHPMRVLTTSLFIRDGEFPLVCVRTSKPVPLSRIPAIMALLRGLQVEAPVAIGDIALPAPAGCDADILITKAVRRR